uniref:BHLH domain-containing protein n=1 Tax=Caenorhabditis japonica TaxID=281687 RepID=A0A8R1HZA9_CAEJA
MPRIRWLLANSFLSELIMKLIKIKILQAFLILKQHLPSLRQFTKRVSKLRILNAAINYIDALLKLIESSEAISQSAIAATLGSLAPSSVRVSSHKKNDMMAPTRSQPLVSAQRPEIHVPAPIATCQPDHSLVDYRSSLATSIPTVPVQMSSVFAPQPTFPYMKSLLDYPTYLYQPPVAQATGSTTQNSHLIVNNQIVSMNPYQCF